MDVSMFIGVPNTIFYHKINLFESETVEIVKKLEKSSQEILKT